MCDYDFFPSLTYISKKLSAGHLPVTGKDLMVVEDWENPK